MFTQPRYFFEPLIETELKLLTKNQRELQLVRQIVLYHLVFTCLSQTPTSVRPQVVASLKANLHHYDLIDKLHQIHPAINQELTERALGFILSNIQSRLENTSD